MAKGYFIVLMLKDRRIRSWIVLILLTITFMVLLYINMQPPEPKQSRRVLMCKECGYTAMMNFSKIKRTKCPECKNGQMAYCMKCRGCQFEFPYFHVSYSEKKKSLAEIRAERIMEQQCPNCRDQEVFPVSNFVWKKNKGKIFRRVK